MPDDRLVFLALETTCDETAAAVLEGPRPPASGVPRVRSSVVASQFDLHERFGGVVPEIASRAHVRQILPVIDEALDRAGVGLDALGMVAVATRPGLVGSLVVGLTAAKALALALGVPLVAVDHLEGHLYACQLAYPEQEVYPCLGLVVSGGHTSLYVCHAPIDAELLGGTIDDAAGEAFDKVASLLGLGFPGGPAIERAAQGGDPAAFAFPRPYLHDPRLDFSFSGLKTAVLYALRGQDAPPTPLPLGEGARRAGEGQRATKHQRQREDASTDHVADLAASFQEAVVEVLVGKTRQALLRTGMRRLGIGGGVAANARFRERLAAMARAMQVELFIPPLALCTDNAAMAGIALAKLAAGHVAELDLDVTPGLVRPSR
jgi:N6-L-threonylcarbamoyladenine synthase